MDNKSSMSRVERLRREKVTRYSIRKYSFGAASVAVAALFMFLGNGAVSANELSKQDTPSVEAPARASENKPTSAESTPAAQPIAEESTQPAAPEVTTPALDKKQLENYISEIKSKLASGKYANKTEASLALLNSELTSAESVLASATTQDELNVAYRNLLNTVSSKLKNKPKGSKEAPKVDTTNGQPTVGKKAENTEKKSDSNSIENTGSKDERNGKEIDKENSFRAETTNTVGNLSYSMEFSDEAKKEIYVYNEEEADINITVNSTAGKITSASVKGGSGQYMNKSKKKSDPLDAQEIDGYGWKYSSILNETQGPATLKITGKPNDAFKVLTPYTKQEDQNAVLGERYIQVSDSEGGKIEAVKNGLTQPGYFKMVVKSQTYKYSIQQPQLDGNKIGVTDVNNLSAADIQKIKDQIKIEHSKTSTDARLASKKGEALENSSTVVKDISIANGTITVTYNDDSTDTASISSIARTNVAPTVDIPYSVDGKKDIYVYANEDIDVDLKYNDDSGKIKSATIKQGGNRALSPVNSAEPNVINNEFDTTFTQIDGETATPAIVKITGKMTKETPGLTASKFPTDESGEYRIVTRYATATDLDDAIIDNTAIGNSYATDPGAFTLVLKSQSRKYDIKAPVEADKVSVTNPSAVTDEEFEKIKEKVKLEYSTTNPDKNLLDKRGQSVDNQETKIQSITKNANNELVVTYSDGSIDKKPLSEFTTLNKQPAIDAVNKAAEDKIAAINSTPNATDEEKAAAIAKVNADKEKALTAINDANVTTIDALNKAKEDGTTAIAADNPVVTKKDTAKAAIEAARKAKEDAIKADINLTEAEKTAAIAKANEAATAATAKIDAATTDAAVDTATTDATTAIGKVNPVAKETAKEAIGNALTAKNNEIDGRKDLSQAEKDAAKAEAKKLADAQLAEIAKQPDNADTPETAAAAQKLVDNAEDKGVGDVTSVNPIAKEAAKQAVADELTKKEEQIDARTDLTTEEKVAAKKEAQAKAKEATDAIDAQPAITDSAEKAKAAQTAVDNAKNKGVADVKAVNPVAAKKTEAKQAIDEALTAKNNAIDARDDLTPEQKTALKNAAKAKADAAKDTIDKATTDADVDQAKTDGATAIANVTPVAKEPAKQAIAKALEDKNAEIDKRTDLTTEEKDAAKAEAKKLADAQLAEIAKQPDVADTPEAAQTAQTAVDAAKKTGVDEVTAVNPEAVTKPAAKKAIDDKLAEQLKAIENTPDATDDEKKVAADAAKALAEEAKKEIDKAGTDAEVNKLQEEAKKEIEKSVPVVEDKPNARKAIDDEATAKKSAIDARDDLTPKAKEDLKAQVDKIAEQAKKSVDAAKTAEAVNGIEESDKAAIKAVGEVNIPADKVLVNDPSALTDDEKAKVLEAVKKVNPDAKEITQDADGNITVTTPDGHQEIITPEQVVKTSDSANEPKAGNDVVKPADKVVVADPTKLTDAEKEKIKAAVEAVNPNSVVTVDEKGNAKVSTPDGQTQVIPVEELVRTVEDTKKPNAGNDIVKPADKTVVANPDKLTDAEKKAIEDKVKAVNPGSTVVVDDKGNATVTTPEGKTAVIPATDLTKSAEDATKPNAGNDIVKPADKTVVANPDKLTDAEKKAVEDKVKAVNPGSTVVVDDKGNATVTTPEGKTAVIPATDLVKSPEDATKPNAGNDIVKPADKTVVANPDALTPEEKKAVEDKVKAVNPGSTVVVDDKGNATVTTSEGKTAVIPATDLTKSAADAAKPNAGNDIVKPADKTVVANPDALTPEEKKAIEDKVKAVNPGSTVVVDDKGNATVTTPEGKTAVIPATDLVKSPEDATKPNAGNDIVKPADKTVVANPEQLTDAEKKAIEDKVKAVNPGSTVVVDDKGNATVTTPAGNTAVIPAEDLTKSSEDAAKPNAGNDVVKPADKTVVANPDALTPEEKKAIEDKVKAVNPGSTVVVDDKGNATVTTPEGKTAVIPASDLTKSAADAAKPNAGDDIVKPADKTVVANPDKLTDAEKKAIEDKVKAVNPGSTVVVDDKGNATVTTPEGKTAVIPASDLTKSAADAAKPNAGNDVNTPAAKTVVANPDQLTDTEKKAIEDKVKAVNPGATVVVDDKGNATVTTPEGKTAVIPASDLTKSAEDATKPNAGNDIVKPADKTVVSNPDALTPEEKKAIEDKVKAVNPGSTVVVDDKGNATVTTPEGKTAVIPATDLTKSAADAAKPNAGDDIVKPADKTVVANPEQLTDAEKKAIEDKVKAVNPGSTVVVDDKGNATVTTPEGKTAVIPATDLVKSPEDATKPNAGNDIVKPADKTVVANPEQLTDAEKKAIEDKVKAVNPGSTVVVDDKGNATVTTPAGNTAVIPAEDLTKSSEDAAKPNAGNDVVKPADKTVVANPDALTPEEKKAIEDKVKAVNPGSTVVVDDKGNATVTTPEGKTAVVPATDLVKSPEDAAKPNAGNDIVKPAAKTVVANPEQLTDAEKKAIEDKVKAVNPGSTVVVDDKGNATVTTPEGKTAVIPATDLTKSAEDAGKENAGNGANTPAAKTVVADPTKLIDEEKAAVKKAVAAVNPGSTVVVDDKGNATVTKADGTVLNIPASDLVIPADNLADEATNAKVKTPAFRTLVGNKDNLTDDEKAAVKKAIEAVNPGSTVVVDNQGNATVTMPDGSTATISKEQLVKDKEDVTKSKHGGDNLDIDLSKVEVTNLANITPEEKAKFQFMILGAINSKDEFNLDEFSKETDEQGNTVYTSKDSKVKITIDKDGNMKVTKDGKTDLAVNIDKAGNVTIVTKEGQVLAIPRDDAFKQRLYVPSNGGGNNGATNTDAKVDKAKLEGAIRQLDEFKFDAETAKEANALSADAKKVFANADATQAEVDAMVKRIEDFMAKVASSTDHATPANDQAAQTPAVDTATTQAASAQANARKVAKELPNTGTADSTVAMVAAAASALLGLGLAGRRRKEDEEA